MATIGSCDLSEKYGGPDRVAEAWLEGRLDPWETRWASELVDYRTLVAAHMRLSLKAKEPPPAPPPRLDGGYSKPVTVAPSRDHGDLFYALRDGDNHYLGLVPKQYAHEIADALNRE